MREIPLTQGMVALVDDEDWDRVSAHRWYAHADRRRDGSVRRWYARTNIRPASGRTTMKLHRFVINAPTGFDVDHKDHDGLNCRRSNIRIATRSQNAQNLEGAHGDALLGVRGVTFDKCGGYYRARVTINYRCFSLGRYNTLDAAKQAVINGRKLLMTHAPESSEQAN